MRCALVMYLVWLHSGTSLLRSTEGLSESERNGEVTLLQRLTSCSQSCVFPESLADVFPFYFCSFYLPFSSWYMTLHFPLYVFFSSVPLQLSLHCIFGSLGLYRRSLRVVVSYLMFACRSSYPPLKCESWKYRGSSTMASFSRSYTVLIMMHCICIWGSLKSTFSNYCFGRKGATKKRSLCTLDNVIGVDISERKKAGQSGRKSVSWYFSAARGRNWYCSTSSRRYTDFARATITRDIFIRALRGPGLGRSLTNRQNTHNFTNRYMIKW